MNKLLLEKLELACNQNLICGAMIRYQYDNEQNTHIIDCSIPSCITDLIEDNEIIASLVSFKEKNMLIMSLASKKTGSNYYQTMDSIRDLVRNIVGTHGQYGNDIKLQVTTTDDFNEKLSGLF